MRYVAALLLVASAPLLAMAQTTTLRALRDTTRPLLIFGSASDPLLLQQQMAELRTHAADLRGRDMQVILIPSRGEAKNDSNLPTARLSPQDGRDAQHHFDIQAGTFTVVLVGKDGGEKLRSTTPLSWERIRSTVDSMPMRQQEMQQR